MATIDQLLSEGSSIMPPNVGAVRDTVYGIGSWVSSGMDSYKSAVEEYDAVKRFLSRFSNLKNDPQALFYAINSVLRQDPILIPLNSRSDRTALQAIGDLLSGKRKSIDNPYTNKGYEVKDNTWQSVELQSGGTEKVNDPRYDSENSNDADSFTVLGYTNTDSPDPDTLKKPIPQNLDTDPILSDDMIFDISNNVIYEPKLLDGKHDLPFKLANNNNTADVTGNRDRIKYGTITTPYEYIKITSQKEAIDKLNALGASIGYSKWSGYELGSMNQWYLNIEPYKGSDKRHPLYTYTPDLPMYRLPVMDKSNNILGNYIDFSKQTPVIGYNLQYGNQSTKDIPLYNNSKIQIPTGFSYDMLLSLDIADDVNLSMNKYMVKYMNAIYDPVNNVAARYDQAAFLLTLVVFKPGYTVNYKFEFIGCPVNYTPNLEGEDEASPSKLHIEFSVVGMVTGNNGTAFINGENISHDNTDPEWYQTTWNDVILKR
jgi:hypothetical protein